MQDIKKGQNVSTHRLHTSIAFANLLFDHNITTASTLNSNYIGITDELKNPKDQEEFNVTQNIEKEK